MVSDFGRLFMALMKLRRIEFLRGIGIRQVRITCGIGLFAYLVSHYSVHALGNISYAAMAEGLTYHIAFWRNPVVAAVFYTAALIHWGLGLWALYERRQFRYTLAEVTQLVLGLSIPVLLVIHFVGVRMPTPLFGYVYNYTNPLHAYWTCAPGSIGCNSCSSSSRGFTAALDCISGCA
jgi:adenylate cyclase